MRAADPERVVAAACAWLGTPYRDQASAKGVGCDCLGLAHGVWHEVVGPELFRVPPYSRDWGEVGRRDVLIEAADTALILALADAPEPGMLLVFRMRQFGTVRLLEAVTAYRAALAECTPDRVPLG